MSPIIKTRLVKIGNSQGIRIPKPLLEQSGINVEVEIEAHENHLIVRPASRSRVGWDEAFATMAEQGDDVLLEDGSMTEWDRTEWEW
ncbi:MAG: AbrB/MazE/SpoVT family DNA-binding domain-containing protein [Stigonema ocellatum SAG 48.90 = DSM 106950]|nr:AbrB/MazE/SpoVT family DNA-binding domain-containing protein [Stigonema ocellatum SAG 48.90 = DSM 106950]